MAHSSAADVQQFPPGPPPPRRRLHTVDPTTGNSASVWGRWLGWARLREVGGPAFVSTEEQAFIGPALGAGEYVVLDERCLVCDVGSGVVLYTPWAVWLNLTPAGREWLEQHPDWGAIIDAPHRPTVLVDGQHRAHALDLD